MIANEDILELLSEAVTRQGEGIWVRVSGRSMGPAFASVTDIRVVADDPLNITPGRLVVFQRDGQWIVHRVMRRTVDADGVVYQVKGDGLAMPDQPDVWSDEIKGVVASIRFVNGAVGELGTFRSRLLAWMLVRRFRMRQWLWLSCKHPRPGHPE